MQSISFQATPILIDGHDTQGQLVLFDGHFAAALARLDGEAHDPAMKGHWHLEAGFGPCHLIRGDVFKTLDAAAAWVRMRAEQHQRRLA